MKVYIDGKLIDEAKASLSAFDAAVQHGVGLFETMRAYHGTVFRLDRHVQRLADSARQLGLTEQLEPEPLAEAVRQTLSENNLADARLRLTVTGGDLSLLAQGKSGGDAAPHTPSVLIQATEPTVYPQQMFDEGVTAVIADPKANPFDPLAGHKSIQYWTRLRTLSTAAAAGAGEALWFSVTNHLVGGAVSNAFLVKDEQLLTPIARGEEPETGIASPTLPGITRAAVMDAADRLDLPVSRQMLTIHDLLGADELLLTNTSWLVLPVVRVEKEQIGDGSVGPITRRLYDELLRIIHQECVDAGHDEEE